MKLLMLLPILALVAAAPGTFILGSTAIQFSLPVSPDFDNPAPDEPQELAKSTLETMVSLAASSTVNQLVKVTREF